MRDYKKPEAELIVLMAEETITTQVISEGDDDTNIDGEQGLVSSIW